MLKMTKTIRQLALLIPLLMLGHGSATAAASFFCCIDTSGKQVCGDILPSECYGKVYREIGPNGRTLRIVKPPPPPPTQEELAKQQAEEEAKRKEEKIALDKKRQDDALLNTYGSVRDIDAMRERALGDTGKEVSAAQENIADLKAKKKKQEEEAATYKNAEDVPDQLRRAIEKLDAQIKVQEQFIAEKKQATAAIRAKYDEEKRRYIELTTTTNQPEKH